MIKLMFAIVKLMLTIALLPITICMPPKKSTNRGNICCTCRRYRGCKNAKYRRKCGRYLRY